MASNTFITENTELFEKYREHTEKYKLSLAAAVGVFLNSIADKWHQQLPCGLNYW